MPHNFFTKQVEKAPAYFLRFVLHDWVDEDCIKILKNIRDSMSKDARVFIVEAVLDEHSQLLQFLMSMQMVTLINAKERTLNEFEQLFEKSGLRLAVLHRNGGLVTLMELEPC